MQTCTLHAKVRLQNQKRMPDQGDKPKKSNRGGPRVAGPGKRMGRPRKEVAHARKQAEALVPVKMSRAKIMPPIVRPSYEQIRDLEAGESPVDTMLRITRWHMDQVEKEQKKKRPNHKVLHVHLVLAREAAKAAAPYCSPRLASVRHSGSVGTWNMDLMMAALAKLPEGELDNFERLFGLIAAAAGPAAPGAAGHPPAAPAAPDRS